MSETNEELSNSDAGIKKVAANSDEQDNRPMPSLVSQQEIESDRARQEEEWRSDLYRLENEISTLRSVLVSKIRDAEEIKKKLGITPLVEFKEDIKQGFQTIKESDPVQKTSAAFKDFGEFASKKLENLRNSNAFRSVEEKVGGAYSSVKKKISSNKSEENEIPGAESPTVPELGVDLPSSKSQDDYVPL